MKDEKSIGQLIHEEEMAMFKRAGVPVHYQLLAINEDGTTTLLEEEEQSNDT